MAKLRYFALNAGLCILLAGAVSAFPRGGQQKGGTSHKAAKETSASVGFAPFNQWKAAVLAGNEAALASLYSSNPPALTRVGKDPVADPAEEAKFWSNFGRSGLVTFNPKILDIYHPQADMTQLVLRVEAKIKTANAPKESAAGTQDVVASVGQLWKQEADGWRIVATQRGNFVSNAPFRLPQPAKPDTALYPPPVDAQKDIDAGVALAKKEHKRVLVVFGANWCYDCHVLNSTFLSPEFAGLIKANYIVVHVNIGDEGDQNLDLGKRLGVGLDRGIPSLAVLGPDGAVIYAQKNGEFESARKIGPSDVRDFLERWKPTGSHGATGKKTG